MQECATDQFANLGDNQVPLSQQKELGAERSKEGEQFWSYD